MLDSDGKDISLKLSGAAYTWDQTNGSDQCYLMIKEFDQVILGQIFITNFVTAFDLDNNKISLTTNINAPDGVKLTLGLTDIDDSSSLGTGAIVGIVLGAIVVLIIAIAVICRCITKGKKDSS